MGIPQQLDQWNYEIVKDYVEKGYLETNYFEFKSAIKNKNPTENTGIIETACAFANTEGGFIIFGIDDIRITNRDRIVGVRNSDLAKEFGDRIKGVNPTIDFDFSNPPIKIPASEKVIFIVHVKKSNLRPHIKVDVGKFYYRTNEGNKQMDYEQIKQGFLRYEERLHQMSLLYLELLTNLTIAENLEKESKKKNFNELAASISLHQFDTNVISAILPNIYSLLNKDSMFIELLIRLRIQLDNENRGLNNFMQRVFNPLHPQQNVNRDVELNNLQLNKVLNKHIIPLLKKTVNHLEQIYEIKNPLSDRKLEVYKDEN